MSSSIRFEQLLETIKLLDKKTALEFLQAGMATGDLQPDVAYTLADEAGIDVELQLVESK